MALVAGTLALLVTAAAGPRPAMMPWPASIELGAGELAVGDEFRVAVGGRGGTIVERAARRLEARLARQAGLSLPGPKGAGKPALEIVCGSPGEPLPHVGMDESYSLVVAPEGAVLRAAEPWGVLRGVETFLQLVEPGARSAFRVPALRVEDRPRFPWRGLLLDAAPRFVPLETLKRTLDGMAAVKLNVLHWRLTGDQGFRVESRRHPELHRLGSDGLFYSRTQVMEVVAYAADRGIRVTPEIDMPSPVASWLVSHPELGAGPGPYRLARDGGPFDAALDPSKEEVYRFLDGLLGEVAALFPDAYMHVGVDEGGRGRWDGSERIAAFRRERGLEDDGGLLRHFTRRVSGIVDGHGKRMIGGEGALQPGLPKGTVFHSRRGQGASAAAGLGTLAISSDGHSLDSMWPAGRHYLVDPWDGGVDRLPEAVRARILGGEATIRAELTTPEALDSRIWPRAAAIAERLWSPRHVKDVDDLYERLDATSLWLEWLGLEHRAGYPRMLQRLAGRRHDDLRRLADVVEPLEDERKDAPRPPAASLPRLLHAARPESEAARHFSRQVDALLADPARQAGRDALRARLEEWRGLDARLRPLLEREELLRECAPLAADVSALARAGLEALDFIEQGRPAPDSWWRTREGLVVPEEAPASGLVVAFRPAVGRLLRAAAGRQ